MRIAMVGPFGLHPNKTMQSRALGLARPLTQRGHEVCIFMPPWQTPAEADKHWQENGITIRYTPLQGGTLGITRQLLRETLAWEPDVVHCFKPKAYSGLVAWWLWQFHRHKLRLIVDTDDWEGWGGWNELAPYSPLQKRFFAWQERWGMSHCHALTVASKALQSIAWSQGIAHDRVVYLPNGPGIEPVEVKDEQRAAQRQKLGLAERPTLLLYSRLFEFETARLVEILRGVATAVSDLAILTIGSSLYESDAAQLRQQLQNAGLLDAVVDVGWVETDELPGLLACADVGIYLMEDTLLNRTKCPVKLADMVAMGLPVVAEDVGQVGEYVRNGRSGLLRPSGDMTGLTTDIIHLLQQPLLREQFSEAARAHLAQNFAWDMLAVRIEQIYFAVK